MFAYRIRYPPVCQASLVGKHPEAELPCMSPLMDEFVFHHDSLCSGEFESGHHHLRSRLLLDAELTLHSSPNADGAWSLAAAFDLLVHVVARARRRFRGRSFFLNMLPLFLGIWLGVSRSISRQSLCHHV